jgi:hypothetical protein
MAKQPRPTRTGKPDTQTHGQSSSGDGSYWSATFDAKSGSYHARGSLSGDRTVKQSGTRKGMAKRRG